MKSYHHLLSANGAYFCVECGKCVALCPMAETAKHVGGTASPKALVKQALDGVDACEMPALTHCQACGSCSRVCPQQVDVAGLIASLREESGIPGHPSCSLCGSPIIYGLDYVTVRINAAVESENDHWQGLSYSSLCPSCKRKAYLRNNS